MRTEARRRDQSNADTALQMEDMALLDMREAAHMREHLLGERSRLWTRHIPQKNHEFVAAETRDKVFIAHRVAQLLPRKPEQPVARGVTEHVVDIFELIQIHEAHGAARSVSGARGNLSLEFCNQAVTAVETRNRVVIGNVQQMLLAFLQRRQGIDKSRDDCLSLLMLRRRKRHLWNARRYLRQRLLKFRQRPRGPLQENVSGDPRNKKQSNQRDAGQRKTLRECRLMRGEVDVDVHKPQKLPLRLSAGRNFNQTVIRE